MASGTQILTRCQPNVTIEQAMSKFVKNLIIDEVRKRLSGVSDCVLVNVVGLKSLQAQVVRKQLRAKGIQLLVVKNSLARRATEGTIPLLRRLSAGEGQAGPLRPEKGLGAVVERPWAALA